ncbi:GNAT family N-acetyltransferase [Paenibacillus sp. N1-5-1-14]|uniref:GNAT family N-acetyltransferase n=1 Tax=Paenibacillus radicibacter TaxID=2972488 RepID=UPI0021593433|nr:GNAT family N-acetyltransferase [Paenibacillus radicibacter]MCR8644417.1 GNAT family N-acetyltransferase [Paenibacillus radicibacter]
MKNDSVKLEIMEVTGVLDTSILQQLVEESLTEGHNHMKRLIEDYDSGTNRFDQAGEALFVCRMNGKIVGVGGINQDPNKGVGIGRLRRVYVLSAYRRHGIGRRLTEVVLERAKKHYRTIVLRTYNPAAITLYQSLGFHEVLDEDQVTHELKL